MKMGNLPFVKPRLSTSTELRLRNGSALRQSLTVSRLNYILDRR